jgi:hypothetical protein
MTKQQKPIFSGTWKEQKPVSNIKFLRCRESKMEDRIKPLVKVKVNWSLCIINHHTIKAYGRAEALLDTFLTSALD